MAAPVMPGRCPECGGQVERVRAEDGGCIEETVATPGGLRRKVRPAAFYACTACDWCSEDAPTAWSADECDTAAEYFGGHIYGNPHEA